MVRCLFTIFSAIFLTACAKFAASSDTPCTLEGRLVKKGICGQYVVQYLSGDTSGLSKSKQWTDPSKGKVYYDVFTVANPCDFKETIQEGAIFSFSLSRATSKNCTLCEAYTPVPYTKNKINLDCITGK